MISIHCHVHDSRVLLDWSRVEGMRNTDEGPVIDWHCWCGGRGRLIAGERSEPRNGPVAIVDLSDSPDGAVGAGRPGC
jgi:hypothetical protein